MPEFSLLSVGVTVETAFTKAVPFVESECVAIAKGCLDKFSGYGLQSSQIAVRRRDQAFNYDLSFQLFNGNGTFKLTADKLHIDLQNAIGKADFEIVEDCIIKMFDVVPEPRIGSSKITANGHMKILPDSTRERFFSSITNPQSGLILTGIITQPSTKAWPEKIRLFLEDSVSFPDALFFSYVTDHPTGKLTRQSIESMNSALVESLAQCGLNPSAESNVKA